jgi:hypothetical protein
MYLDLPLCIEILKDCKLFMLTELTIEIPRPKTEEIEIILQIIKLK